MQPEAFLIDRIKRLAIVAMCSDDVLLQRLVLKGGNLIDVVFGISTRSSVDIDFSIEGEFELSEDFENRVNRAVKQTFRDAGYMAFDINLRSVPPNMSDSMKAFWGGYKIDFKVIDLKKYEQFRGDDGKLRRNALSIGKRGSTCLRIDISKHEYCQEKRPELIDGFTVFTYTPEMCVAEKLRAVCQQMPEYVQVVKSNPSARSRDFLDIHTLCEEFGVDFARVEFHSILRETFAIKRVPLRLLNTIKQFRNYHKDDFVAVISTVKPNVALKEFDYYFDYVVDRCCQLKPLWDE